MNKMFHRLAALCLTAAALSSCSRTAYTSFNPQTPAYLGSTRTVAAPAPRAEAPTTVAVVPAEVAPIAARAAAPVASPARPVAAAEVASPTVATTTTTPAKPTLVQRIALKKVLKQVAKAQSRQQNTASVTHTAAKGAPLTVAIIGLAALVVGLIVSSGLLITLGAIVLAVGIVLLLLSAL